MNTVKQLLSKYVPRLYAWAVSSAANDTSLSEKLGKLVDVWRTNKYFDENCYEVVFKFSMNLITNIPSNLRDCEILLLLYDKNKLH